MREAIERILEKIDKSLKNIEVEHTALLSGDTGIVLFSYLYNDYLHKQAAIDEAATNIQKLAENSILVTAPTFCSGKSGANWFFTYLFYNDILNKEDRDFLCDDDAELERIAVKMMEDGNYDFLHGSIGIAYYLLYSKTYNIPLFETLFESLFDLFDQSSNCSMIPFYDSEADKIVPDIINLGLAHGLPSILKFCIACYTQNVCVNQSKLLAGVIIEFLKANTNSSESQSFFPCFLTIGKNLDSYSRLAWCYGDLTIGYILYQAGEVFSDENLKEFALNILVSTTERRTVEQSTIFDCGICHGSAGLVHIYNKLWRSIHLDTFKQTRDFWLKRTLDMLEETDWNKGYNRYLPNTDSYEPANSFLDGSAGIGLVLLSYITKDFSWDYPLMLN
jgi:lantibiotic modifying enzyme